MAVNIGALLFESLTVVFMQTRRLYWRNQIYDCAVLIEYMILNECIYELRLIYYVNPNDVKVLFVKISVLSVKYIIHLSEFN